jgi:transposase-like protein
MTRLQRQFDREHCIAAVARALAEGRPLSELAPELGRSYKQILRYKDLLMSQIQTGTRITMEEYRADQLEELAELKSKLEDPAIKPDRKVELALSIIDREIKLLGTAAPEKLQVSGPQLNPMYLAIAKAMADVAEDDQAKVLEFAKSLVRPLELTADCFPPPMPEIPAPQLTEGEPNDLV